MDRTKRVRPSPQTIEELMGCKWWKGALRFLRQNKKVIELAKSPTVKSQGTNVSLGGRGFTSSTGSVESATIKTVRRHKPTVKILRTPAEVLEQIRSCDSTSSPIPEKRIVEGIINDLAEIALRT